MHLSVSGESTHVHISFLDAPGDIRRFGVSFQFLCLARASSGLSSAPSWQTSRLPWLRRVWRVNSMMETLFLSRIHHESQVLHTYASRSPSCFSKVKVSQSIARYWQGLEVTSEASHLTPPCLAVLLGHRRCQHHYHHYRRYIYSSSAS